MRYCKECGQISDDLWAFCESCGVETDHIGEIDEEQAQLFEFTDVDKVRSVNQQLKAAYTAAVEAVAKAETRLRKAHEELEASGRVWLQFWQLANSGGVDGHTSADNDPEPDEIGLCMVSPYRKRCADCGRVSCERRQVPTTPDDGDGTLNDAPGGSWSDDLFDELAGDGDE